MSKCLDTEIFDNESKFGNKNVLFTDCVLFKIERIWRWCFYFISYLSESFQIVDLLAIFQNIFYILVELLH